MEFDLNFYKGKKFLPKIFADENHIEEIKGVYVPFWLCDCRVDAEASYDAECVHRYESGNNRITEIEHYDVRRTGYLCFEKIPVDASTKMPDEYMDAIEPYDYGELKPFSTAYLPGFLADKFDVTPQDSMERIEQRAKSTAGDSLRGTLSAYDSVTPMLEEYQLNETAMHYALMPVWLLSTRWKEKNFLFAMNGQTGKLVGDLPVSKGKYWAWFAGIAASVTALLTLLLH